MKRVARIAMNTAVILLGTALSAFSMGVFVLPYNMLVPGVTGLGRLAEIYFSWDVTVVVGVCNAALLLLGLAILGWRFAATIVLGSVFFPTFLAVFQSVGAFRRWLRSRSTPLSARECWRASVWGLSSARAAPAAGAM